MYVGYQPGLPSEFLACVNYSVRPCLKHDKQMNQLPPPNEQTKHQSIKGKTLKPVAWPHGELEKPQAMEEPLVPSLMSCDTDSLLLNLYGPDGEHGLWRACSGCSLHSRVLCP